MAGKGQKFKKYPDEIKLEIASKAREGRGYRSIGREYPNIPTKTIERRKLSRIGFGKLKTASMLPRMEEVLAGRSQRI